MNYTLESIVKSESSLTDSHERRYFRLLESIVKSESSLTIILYIIIYIGLRVLLNQNHL